MATFEHDRAALRGTFAVVLAGGKGTRLFELTADQCKPAIPFIGRHRLIDFTLANLLRSGLTDALIATQYKPQSLLAHLSEAWRNRFAARRGRLTMRNGARLPAQYQGTADAVFRNLDRIDAKNPTHVLVLGADHIYDMDYGAMIAAHAASRAPVTVAASIVPRRDAGDFGIVETGLDGRAKDFLEKPVNPPGMADAPDFALASMGIYIFSWPWLRARLTEDAADTGSSHDFGHDILPRAVQAHDLNVYRFSNSGNPAYWRDVGTLDAYREAAVAFAQGQRPCRLPHEDVAIEGEIEPRTASPVWRDSIVLPGAFVAPGARLHRSIVAAGTTVPPQLVVGDDPHEDARWFRVTAQGTALITRQMVAEWQSRRPLFHVSRGVPSTGYPAQSSAALSRG
jgi:glucose-1-phosphate adenylyltransferase